MTGCTHIIDLPIPITESVNSRVLRQIMDLPDGLRKEIRLLAKQYEILAFYKMPDDTSTFHPNIKLMIRRQPYILEYRHFGGDEVFEYKIEAERLMQ